MADLCPIALCNIAYKILAKLLVNRLKLLLDGLISEFQSAFIGGRSIFDNVILAFEISHSFNYKRHGKNGIVALKTDMSKAYDHLKWLFFKQVMLRMGFHEAWVSRVILCVSSVNYIICHNGDPIGTVIPQWGLR